MWRDTSDYRRISVDFWKINDNNKDILLKANSPSKYKMAKCGEFIKSQFPLIDEDLKKYVEGNC